MKYQPELKQLETIENSKKFFQRTKISLKSEISSNKYHDLKYTKSKVLVIPQGYSLKSKESHNEKEYYNDNTEDHWENCIDWPTSTSTNTSFASDVTLRSTGSRFSDSNTSSPSTLQH